MVPTDAILVAVKILQSPIIRSVFEAIAKPRTISVRELKEQVQDSGALSPREVDSNSKESLEKSISALKEANLIKEQQSVVRDFNTLYLTANGLNAVQALRDPQLMSSLNSLL